VKLLLSPIIWRMGLGLVAATAAFLGGSTIIRRMRRNIVEESTIGQEATAIDSLPLHTYNAVIQQLKQQKYELQHLQQEERRRAKTTENISAAVLSNLSSGVMFFAPNGLVRQANTSAKRILGFGSPVGMSAEEIFRDAKLESPGGEPEELAREIQKNLHDKTPINRIEALYLTPAGERRTLDITVTAVYDPAGNVLGAACLINDETELSRIRSHQQLRGEISAEMALELRSSLNTISGYARQLADSGDEDTARRVAADIVTEAAHLDHTIGGFLAGAKTARAGFGV
jgi:PAS domain S-box-containing protein